MPTFVQPKYVSQHIIFNTTYHVATYDSYVSEKIFLYQCIMHSDYSAILCCMFCRCYWCFRCSRDGPEGVEVYCPRCL